MVYILNCCVKTVQISSMYRTAVKQLLGDENNRSFNDPDGQTTLELTIPVNNLNFGNMSLSPIGLTCTLPLVIPTTADCTDNKGKTLK